ncbi:hypothetical protein PILCRDRAFT_7213 [Piloderma croceum F 1598]|uniref:Uncharacterized protein n=1 Tax=Piloderma croceum (strain F 1598) TaxID=765440 RepID=A0A0C3BAE1_PILCF|nr:hypothetical protein PILCRDRAFT_7213 [Piloderma croceum F 1598]
MTHENENEAAGQPKEVCDTPVTVTAKCLNIVERYRAGTIYKGDTIYEFAKTIPAEEDGATESPGKTLQAYISMLDDWDHEHTLSNMDEHREEAQEEPSTDYDRKKHKRAEKEARDENEDKCDEPVHRRPKIDPRQFPWALSDRIEGTHLLNSGAAPEFPDLEWKSLLSGLAVNLDAVFSGCYSTEHNSKITHEINDFTISTQEATTSKAVKSAGDWFITWNQTSAATTFAFPHRSKECQDYGRHILDLFAAFTEEHHHLILNYD